MADPTPVAVTHVPASALAVALARHEALATAYRADATPQLEVPSFYAVARQVVGGRGYFELYRRVAT